MFESITSSTAFSGFLVGCTAERIVSPAPLSLLELVGISAPILAKLSQTVKLSHQKIVASGRHQGLSIQESTSAIPGRAVEAETPRIRQEPEKSKTIHCRSSRFHFLVLSFYGFWSVSDFTIRILSLRKKVSDQSFTASFEICSRNVPPDGENF